MSDTTTWAVLGDGRYIRILVNKGPGKELATLNADNLEALADLRYELSTSRSPHASGDVGKSDKRSYIQLQADFTFPFVREWRSPILMLRRFSY